MYRAKGVLPSVMALKDKIFAAFCCVILLSAQAGNADVLLRRQRRQIVFPDARGDCTTVAGGNGECIRITQCPELLRSQNFNLLVRSQCGFEGSEPKVCCPLDGSSGGGSVTRPSGTTPPARRVTPPVVRPTRTRVSPIPQPGNRGFSAPQLPSDCGRSDNPGTRIVGGREANLGTWPWMTVLYDVRGSGLRSPSCGAALVSRRHVITAAHCVVTGPGSNRVRPAAEFAIRLGEHNLFSDDDGAQPEDFDVESIVIHEDFVPATFKNDIAVLRLAADVRFNSGIRPVCLPYTEFRTDSLAGKNVFVTGWGVQSFNGPSSDVLREVRLGVPSNEECRKSYEKEIPDFPNVYVCAGRGQKDACQGDSGGPMVIPGQDNRFFLVGIVSFGKRCASPGVPGVYTRVTEFLDWLAPLLS